MNNPAPHIRRTFYALLNNTITHKAFVVPAFEGEWVGAEVPYKIEIAAMDSFNNEDKASYNHDFSTTLEVIEEGSTWQRSNVDAIGEKVMKKLRPTKYTTGFADTEDWQVTNLKVNTLTYMEDTGASGTKITRLLMRVDFNIHQRN